jgi:hypothetical protein
MVVKQENPLKAGLAGISVGPASLLIWAFFEHVSPWSLLKDSSHLPILMPLAFMMLGGLFSLTRFPNWRRLRHLRQAAAQGDVTIPLAPIQLPLSEVSFHLPLQMIPKRHWSRIALISLFLVYAVNFWAFGGDFPDLLATGEWVWTLGFVLLWMFCLVAPWRSYSYFIRSNASILKPPTRNYASRTAASGGPIQIKSR